ncbi:diacylglycerol O-acyltransferase [Pseudoscourfieldia marina]
MAPQRRLSFTSRALASGSFPAPCHCPEPVISILNIVPCLPSRPLLSAALNALVSAEFRFAQVPTAVPACCGLGSTYVWMPTNVSIAKHIVDHEAVPDVPALWEVVNQETQGPLRANKDTMPWWEVHVIPLQGSSGRGALLLRVHHVIGDGIGLATALRTILTDSEGNDAFKSATKKFERKPATRSCCSPLGFLWDLGVVLTLPSLGADVPLPKLQDGKPPLRYGTREFANVTPFSVSRIKGIAKHCGATFNDVVLAAVAGAVAKVCDDAPKKNGMVRALMPFAAPRSATSRGGMLRNLWSMASVKLPVTTNGGDLSGVERIRLVAKETAALKASWQPAMLLFMSNYVLNALPGFVTRQIAHDSFSRHSFVITNVPGPDQKMHLAGSAIDECHLLFPNIIPQLSFLSYNGTVYASIIAAGKASELAAAIEREVLAMELDVAGNST